MVKEGADFVVYDAKTGEDITRAVLTQIIVEQESKGGQNLLPISFLRQLIAFYGDSMQWLVPSYLESSMRSFAHNQEQMRRYLQETFGGMFPFGQFGQFEQVSKQNMAMIERAMKMVFPFGPEGGAVMPGNPGEAGAAVPAPGDAKQAIDQVKRQLDALQRQLDGLVPAPRPAKEE
jgi:polyhydroxyalkanoate synthesis repressor PhaR